MLGCAAARDGIEEPVRVLHVLALDAEDLELPARISSAASITRSRTSGGTRSRTPLGSVALECPADVAGDR